VSPDVSTDADDVKGLSAVPTQSHTMTMKDSSEYTVISDITEILPEHTINVHYE